MAVHTPVPIEVLDKFLENYPLGKAIAFKGIAEGVENSNFMLETPRGRFILTLFEKRVDPGDLPFFVGVMEHLAARNFPAPSPVADRDGKCLQTLCGRPALVVNFLPGVSPEQPDAALCRVFGEGLAQLHRALSDCPLVRANDLGPARWREMSAANRDRAAQLDPALPMVLERDLDELAARWPANLPAGLIHADLFPDNALFTGAKLSGVIDFYFACRDALAYDLAVCLNAWCIDDQGRCDHGRAGALLTGYETVRILSEEEKRAMPLLARGAAMRFVLTRLADWRPTAGQALVRIKDPMAFALRLDFHRRAVGLGDYIGRVTRKTRSAGRGNQ